MIAWWILVVCSLAAAVAGYLIGHGRASRLTEPVRPPTREEMRDMITDWKARNSE